MYDPLQRLMLSAAYQLSLLLAITLLPVAVLARQGGLTLPLGRLVERTGRAYAATRTTR